MLTLAYKSNLLASLVRKEYEKPVDTFEVYIFIYDCSNISTCDLSLQDLLQLPIILSVPKGTSVPHLMEDSPRKVVRDVYAYNAIKLGGIYEA